MNSDYHKYKFDQGKTRYELIHAGFARYLFKLSDLEVSDQRIIAAEFATSGYTDGCAAFLMLHMDWSPEEFYTAVGRVLTFGAQKYEDHSWKKVPDGVRRYTSAFIRHVVEASPRDLDPESGMPHAWHAACNIYFLWYFNEKST